MNKLFRNILSWLLAFALAVPVTLFGTDLFTFNGLEIPRAQALYASGDGIIVYGKSATSTPQYRIWTSASGTWSAESAVGGATFSGTPRFVMTKAARLRNEAIAGVVNDTGTLFVVRWNGSTWSQLGSNITTGINPAVTKIFDIDYEYTSGEAIVVVGGAVDPTYYTWNGTTWSGPTTITQTTKTTGTIRWIELTNRSTSGSNEVALTYADANGDLNALIWSGSAWTEQTAAAGALSTAIENNGGATTMRSFDTQFESSSGALLIAWGNNATTGIQYVTRDAAGSWGTVSTQAGNETPSLVDLAAEPWGDRISFQSVDDTTANSNDGLCATWDGAAWVNVTVNCDSARDSQEAGDMTGGSGWVQSGADQRAISFYSDVADLTLDYNYWVPGTGWTSAQAFTPSPNCISANSDDDNIVVETNPFNDAEVMVIRGAGTAICAQKTNYAGATTWNFGNAGDGSSLATPSVSQYQPVGFTYFKYQEITVGTTGTQTATMNIPSTNNYVGGAFTMIRNAGTANVTQIVITDTGTVNANSNLSNVDIYYETAATCVFDTTETLFGTAASFNASEKATITGTMSVGTSQICVYVVLDVGSGATDGQTVEIEISNPSTEVTVSAGVVSPATAVAIAGTTTLSTPSGPFTEDLMRHGNYFQSGTEQKFFWAN